MKNECGGAGEIEVETEIEVDSGFAADWVLTTLSLKREIDSAQGSLPRRELPTAERW